MRIAISSTGGTPESLVDFGFGRSAGFMVYDDSTRQYEYIDNSASAQKNAGVGIQTVRTLAQAGVQTLLTGHLGPKAAQALEKEGIQTYSLLEKTTVSQAVQAFLNKRLPRLIHALTPDDSSQPPCPGRAPGRGAGQGRGMGGKGRGMGGGGRSSGSGQR
ncbi:MAG: NifB/NifX family molybdenum-iron cluster-binding protein [Desulfohalobiaceae bacterium]